MQIKISWKAKAWLLSLGLGLVFFIPLMYLLPHGSTDPSEIGFWYAFFMAFISGIPVTYYIIKWRQKHLNKTEKNE